MADVKAPEIDSSIKKKLMFINRKAPYGTIYALEALEVVLISAAFEQDVSLAFLDDGVYQLTKGQNTSAIGMKNFSPAFRALGDYEIKKLYVERESLDERGLRPEDLMEITYEVEEENFAQKSSIHIVSRSELTKIMAQQDVLLSF
jgi:tRNA 2-thiouridine synthesizing protein C